MKDSEIREIADDCRVLIFQRLDGIPELGDGMDAGAIAALVDRCVETCLRLLTQTDRN